MQAFDIVTGHDDSCQLSSDALLSNPHSMSEVYTAVRKAFNLDSAQDFTAEHLVDFIPIGADPNYWLIALRNYESQQSKPQSKRHASPKQRPRRSTRNFSAAAVLAPIGQAMVETVERVNDTEAKRHIPIVCEDVVIGFVALDGDDIAPPVNPHNPPQALTPKPDGGYFYGSEVPRA